MYIIVKLKEKQYKLLGLNIAFMRSLVQFYVLSCPCPNFIILLTCRNPPIPKKNKYDTMNAGIQKDEKSLNLVSKNIKTSSFQDAVPVEEALFE